MAPDETLKQALFEVARHLSTSEERRGYLDRACGDDMELRRQIEALLELQSAANEYFESQPDASSENKDDRCHESAGPD